MLTNGMHYAWPSPSLPKLLKNEESFTISSSEGSTIAILILLSDIIGGMVAAFTLDRIGRKWSILLSSPPFLVAWIMIANAPNIWVLYASRILAGLGEGISFVTAITYISEIAQPRRRGLLCSSCTVVLAFGMLLMECIGSYFTISTAAFISCTIPILHFFSSIFIPESPYYLILKREEVLARANLKLLRGTEDVEDEFMRISDGILQQGSNKCEFLDLFKVKRNRKACLNAITLRTFQQLTGVTAFMYYTTIIFEEAGSNLSPSTTSIIYFTVYTTGTMISSLVLDRAGRRPLLLSSIIGCSLALLVEGIYFYLSSKYIMPPAVRYIPSLAFVVYIVMYSLGLQTVPVLLLGEIFSTDIKAYAVFFNNMYFCILASITAKFFQIMKDEFGMYVPFFVFFSFSLLGIVVYYYCVPETKGKTLEDIQLEMKN